MDLPNVRELKQKVVNAILKPKLIPIRFAVGIGLTNKKKQYRLAIRLEHELQRPVLKTLFKVEGILNHFTDAEVQVEVIGRVRYRTPLSPAVPESNVLRIGSSISHFRGPAGTLGFFAKRTSDGRIGVVSCNHVIGLLDKGKKGDDILRPAKKDGGKRPDNAFATLDDSFPPLHEGGLRSADCAFAVLKGDPDRDISSLGVDGDLVREPAELIEELEVRKIGRTTHERTGVVTACDVDLFDIEYDFFGPTVTFNNVIEIQSKEIQAASARTFSDPGDSGSAVYARASRQPVGLLFAESASGGPFNSGLSFAHPIAEVETALGVKLVVS